MIPGRVSRQKNGARRFEQGHAGAELGYAHATFRGDRLTQTPAKVSPPRVTGAIRRSRLERPLAAALRRGGAVWLRGQPGSGKSTLVASWLAARRLPAVWLTLDAADADLGAFFHALGLAARRTRRRVPLAIFGPENAADPERFARNAFRGLFAALPRPCVLVLDDCDAIRADAAPILAIRTAIAELAPGLALILASRAAPPAALARHRANGALEVVGSGALDFTPREALALARARRSRATPARVEALRRGVGGWTAGLVLALARGDAPGGGDGRAAAFDFFAGEVLARLDPAARRVLLESALLDAPTGELAAHATGDATAGRVLAALARDGLFTTRREGGPPSFEFHGLFRDFLLARGREELPPGRADAVRRAAAGMLAPRRGAEAEAAIALLQRAGAHEEAAALVAREAEDALRAGRAETVLRWIAGLPAALREADPRIRCCEGAALVARDPVAARRRLEPALSALDARGDAAGVWQSWTALVESILFEWSDLTALGPRMAELERLRARHPFPSAAVEQRVTLAVSAVLAHLAADYPQLAPWGARALALAREPGDAALRLTAGAYHLMYRDWWFGDFAAAQALVPALAPLARAPDAPPVAAILWLTMEATHHGATGDGPAAARAAGEARRLAAESGVHVWDVVLHVHEIWSALGRDELRAAREGAARLRASVRPGNEIDAGFAGTYDGFVALRAGDPGAAARAAEDALAAARRRREPTVELVASLVRARALALGGPERAAAAAIAEARAVIARFPTPCFEHVLALLEAERALARGDAGAVAAALARALRTSGAGAAHAQYFYSRDDLARLVGEALRRGIEVDAARALVRVRGLAAPPGAGAEWPRAVAVRVLGPFSVLRDGVPLDASGRRGHRPLEVLRVLAALGGRGVPEGRVAELLWPDSEGDAARHALETALYRLRRLVGQDVVVHRGHRLSIADGCWVDALALDACLSGWLARPGQREAAEAARVVDLYAGPLLPDSEAPWAAQAREALRRKLRRWLATLEGGTVRGDAARLRAALSARDPALGAPEPGSVAHSRAQLP